MTDSGIRVAVVGAGHWGKNLVRNFARLDALAAIVDTDPENLKAAGKVAPKARLFSDPDEVFGSSDFEAVAIATPPATHGPLAAAAINAGKHVFVEKPLCLDVAQGQALGAAAEQRNLTLMVGHLLLYHPAFNALSAAIAAGQIGEIRYIYSNRLNLGRIRKEENALWSFAPHDISMILRLVGELPEKVVTTGGAYLSPGVADTTLTHMDFNRNIQAHIFVSWLHPYKDHRLVIVGSDAMIVFHDSLQGDAKLQLYPHNVAWNGNVPSVVRADAEPIAYIDEEPLLRECGHFLDCVRSGKKPLSDAAEGLRVLRVLDACQRALQSGKAVTLYDQAAE